LPANSLQLGASPAPAGTSEAATDPAATADKGKRKKKKKKKAPRPPSPLGNEADEVMSQNLSGYEDLLDELPPWHAELTAVTAVAKMKHRRKVRHSVDIPDAPLSSQRGVTIQR
jgi:hypothetical protein